MTDPNRVEVNPVKIFCGHAMRGVRAAIEQNGSGFSLQPETCGGTARMKDGSSGAEHDELHVIKLELKIENRNVSEPRARVSIGSGVSEPRAVCQNRER